MAARWVNLAQLAEETGFAVRTLQYIRQREPGVLVTRERKGATEYRQPECSQALFKRERELARREAKEREQPADFEKARARKMEADARLAEIELAAAESRVVLAEDYEKVPAEMADRLRAGLINLPSTYGLELERLGVEPAAAEAVLERIAEDLTQRLLGVADEMEDEADRNDDGGDSDTRDDGDGRSSSAPALVAR